MLAWHRLWRKWLALSFRIYDFKWVYQTSPCDHSLVEPAMKILEAFYGQQIYSLILIHGLSVTEKLTEVLTYEWILCLYWFMIISYNLYHSQLQLIGQGSWITFISEGIAFGASGTQSSTICVKAMFSPRWTHVKSNHEQVPWDRSILCLLRNKALIS